MTLAEEISTQPSIDCATWLLLITLMKIYEGKEQAEQEKVQNVQSEEKRAPGNVLWEPSPVFKEIKKFKEKPDAKWDKGSGKFRARHHPAKFPSCRKESKERLTSEGNRHQQKADAASVSRRTW